MNEIVICTESLAYTSGDTVLGCVFVKLQSPSGACGISLRVNGYEKYKYCTAFECEGEACERTIQDSKDHIPHQTVQLYRTDGPIRCGHYMFPFKLKLPDRIPGSFHFKDTLDQWETTIVYELYSELNGSEDVQCLEEVLIHDTHDVCSDWVKNSVKVRGRLPLQSCTIEVSSNVNKSVYHSGETVKVNVDFSRNGSYKPRVTKLHFKLVQELRLKLRTSTGTEFNIDASTNEAQHSHPNTPDNLLPLQTNNLWESEMDIGMHKGIQNFMLPLRSPDNCGSLAPTTFGAHIFCSYAVLINATFDTTTVQLSQPIPYVRQRPQGNKVEEPEWASLCKLKAGFLKHALAPSVQDFKMCVNLQATKSALEGMTE